MAESVCCGIAAHPELLSQWSRELNTALSPEDVAAGSGKKVWWRCDYADHHGGPEHVWQQSPNARLRKSSDGSVRITQCPFCVNRRLLPGFNDLGTKNPALAAELADDLNEGLTAADLFASSNTSVQWRCSSCSYVWASTVNNRDRGQGCPRCAGKVVTPGADDLATLHPRIASEWAIDRNDRAISEISASSHYMAWWHCPADDRHIYQMQVAKRTARGFQCSVCAGRQVLSGVNDLATLDPEKAALWDGQSNDRGAHEVSVASDYRAWWRCDRCDRSWQGRVYADARCPRCDKFSSQGQNDIEEIVRKLVPDYEVCSSVRSVLHDGRAELDIYIPELKIAVEFNGIYWHCELNGHDQNKHRSKLQKCQQAGIRLLVVWSDDFERRRETVIVSLARKLGALDRLGDVLGDDAAQRHMRRFNARSLSFGQVPAAQAQQFLREHHIQGASMCDHYFGLSTSVGELCAVLGLRAPRSGSRTALREGEYEIRRFATCGVVRGGFTKMLAGAQKYLQAHGHPVSAWVSFAAADASDGGLYEDAGFTPVNELAPDYSYAGSSTRWVRESKQSHTKRNFASSATREYREGLTERELAQINKLYRVWDYGKTKYWCSIL